MIISCIQCIVLVSHSVDKWCVLNIDSASAIQHRHIRDCAVDPSWAGAHVLDQLKCVEWLYNFTVGVAGAAQER